MQEKKHIPQSDVQDGKVALTFNFFGKNNVRLKLANNVDMTMEVDENGEDVAVAVGFFNLSSISKSDTISPDDVDTNTSEARRSSIPTPHDTMADDSKQPRFETTVDLPPVYTSDVLQQEQRTSDCICWKILARLNGLIWDANMFAERKRKEPKDTKVYGIVSDVKATKTIMMREEKDSFKHVDVFHENKEWCPIARMSNMKNLDDIDNMLLSQDRVEVWEESTQTKSLKGIKNDEMVQPSIDGSLSSRPTQIQSQRFPQSLYHQATTKQTEMSPVQMENVNFEDPIMSPLSTFNSPRNVTEWQNEDAVSVWPSQNVKTSRKDVGPYDEPIYNDMTYVVDECHDSDHQEPVSEIVTVNAGRKRRPSMLILSALKRILLILTPSKLATIRKFVKIRRENTHPKGYKKKKHMVPHWLKRTSSGPWKRRYCHLPKTKWPRNVIRPYGKRHQMTVPEDHVLNEVSKSNINLTKQIDNPRYSTSSTIMVKCLDAYQQGKGTSTSGLSQSKKKIKSATFLRRQTWNGKDKCKSFAVALSSITTESSLKNKSLLSPCNLRQEDNADPEPVQDVVPMSTDCQDLVVPMFTDCQDLVVPMSTDCQDLVVPMFTDCQDLVVPMSTDCQDLSSSKTDAVEHTDTSLTGHRDKPTNSTQQQLGPMVTEGIRTAEEGTDQSASDKEGCTSAGVVNTMDSGFHNGSLTEDNEDITLTGDGEQAVFEQQLKLSPDVIYTEDRTGEQKNLISVSDVDKDVSLSADNIQNSEDNESMTSYCPSVSPLHATATEGHVEEAEDSKQLQPHSAAINTEVRLSEQKNSPSNFLSVACKDHNHAQLTEIDECHLTEGVVNPGNPQNKAQDCCEDDKHNATASNCCPDAYSNSRDCSEDHQQSHIQILAIDEFDQASSTQDVINNVNLDHVAGQHHLQDDDDRTRARPINPAVADDRSMKPEWDEDKTRAQNIETFGRLYADVYQNTLDPEANHGDTSSDNNQGYQNPLDSENNHGDYSSDSSHGSGSNNTTFTFDQLMAVLLKITEARRAPQTNTPSTGRGSQMESIYHHQLKILQISPLQSLIQLMRVMIRYQLMTF